MAFSKTNHSHTLKGLFVVALFAYVAYYFSELSFFKHLAISPLVIGIALGMVYANTFRETFPKEWERGILFSTKTLLRLGIVLYGFRITFMQILPGRAGRAGGVAHGGEGQQKAHRQARAGNRPRYFANVSA